MSSDVPLITVALPVYNAGHYLRCAVLSILNQTEARFELLLIDDGSTDQALQSISDIKDRRLMILQDGLNKGLATRLNEALAIARGKYFARMDADDVAFPERLESQLARLEAEPELDLVAARVIRIDESSNPVGIFPVALTHQKICRQPWVGFHFPHPAWMGKLSWFRRYGYKANAYYCEDQELLLRAYPASHFASISEVMLGYRIRSKPDVRKLRKTYAAFFRIQLKQFSLRRQWLYCLGAVFVFVLRVLKTYIPSRINNSPLPGAMGMRWRQALDACANYLGRAT